MAASNRNYVSEISMPMPKEPLTVMLLGKTGNGKSSFGNALLRGSHFWVKSGMLACQDHEPKLKEVKIRDRELSVIDTPGVLDNINPDMALKGICSAISLCPGGVTAFIIVLRADVRFTEEESKAVLQLQTLFGDSFLDYAICVFTHGDSALREGRKKFYDEVEQIKKEIEYFNKLMTGVGDRVMLVNCNDIGKKELTEFVLLLDSMRKINSNKRYTNVMFTEAQLCYEKANGHKLKANQQETQKELRRVEAQNSKNMQERIAELQKQVKDQEERIKKIQVEAAKSAESVAPKECVIL